MSACCAAKAGPMGHVMAVQQYYYTVVIKVYFLGMVIGIGMLGLP
jgi:hypothetical protein